jgi:hypothetical protein
LIGVGVSLAFSAIAQAQWSIGKAGSREAPKGLERYVYLVMSDPLPGREFDFTTAIRTCIWAIWCSFRTGPALSASVSCRSRPYDAALYRRGNLIIWDQEGDDLGKIQSVSKAAIAGGKSRLIPGFDYSPRRFREHDPIA